MSRRKVLRHLRSELSFKSLPGVRLSPTSSPICQIVNSRRPLCKWTLAFPDTKVNDTGFPLLPRLPALSPLRAGSLTMSYYFPPPFSTFHTSVVCSFDLVLYTFLCTVTDPWHCPLPDICPRWGVACFPSSNCSNPFKFIVRTCVQCCFAQTLFDVSF